MATLTVTPNDPKTGQVVSIVGAEFAPSTICTIKCDQLGVQSEVTSDAAGYFGSSDVADHAVATLTLAGNPADAETVTLGAVTYRFKNTMAAVNDVKIGADAATSLANLKKAVNATGTAGTEYFAGTVVHPTVAALTLTATTLLFYAKTGGTGGNALASTETLATGGSQFGGATFSGGSAATAVDGLLLDFENAGRYKITGTDGTNTVDTYVQVWDG